MLTDIHSKETDQLFKTSIVQQTAFWSVVKTMLGVETIALNFKINRLNLNNIAVEERIVESDLLVIVQHLDRNHSIAYVPYGPELEPQEDLQGQFLEELSECLRTYIPSNCIMIRYDLCWESYWAKDTSYFDENGHWAGPPENPIPRRDRAGTRARRHTRRSARGRLGRCSRWCSCGSSIWL